MNCNARTLRFLFCCCACTIRLCKRRTLRLACFQLIERQSTDERRLAPAAPFGAASSSRRIPVFCVVVIVIRTERPRGSLHDYSHRDLDQGDWPRAAIPIITIGPWLSPRSFTRPPVGFPCGRLSSTLKVEEKVGLTTFHVYTSGGLGCASPPAARHLRQGNRRPLNLATCLLAQA